MCEAETSRPNGSRSKRRPPLVGGSGGLFYFTSFVFKCFTVIIISVGHELKVGP